MRGAVIEWPVLRRLMGGTADQQESGDPPGQRLTDDSFARVFDLSPLILTVTDLETGRFVEVNDAFVRATGFARDEAIGRTPIDLNLWITPEQRFRGLAEIRAGNVIRGQEVQLRIKDGSIIHVLLSGAKIEFEGRPSALSALTDVTDRKRAENLLARYKLLAQNSRDIVIFFRPDGSIAEANKAASDIYGYTQDELLQLNVADLRDPETLHNLSDQFRQALEQGIRFETRHRKRDGSTFPVEVVSQSAELGGERLVLSIVRDVSARVESEMALRRSEERLRLALDAAGMSTWELDLATGVRRAGGYDKQLLGADPDTYEGILALIHPDDRERVRAAVETAVEHGGDYAEEIRFLHPCGDIRWIAARGRAVDRGEGRSRTLAGVSFDVTERKGIETRLRASELHFRALAEAMPQLVWSCAPDGRCDYLSRQWVEYTGIPEAPQLGRGWMEAVHPDDREQLSRAWRIAVEETGQFETEFRIRRHDGVYRWFMTRASPVRDEDGAIVKWYGSNTDIDDIKQAEERRREQIDTLAHDLQNPLAAIKAQSQVLQRRIARGDPIDPKTLESLTETASNMAGLIDEMSDASALAAGRTLQLYRGSVDIVDLVDRCVSFYAGTSSLHSIRVERTADRIVGQWDRGRLGRVFSNLLSNAIKYSPGGGEIRISIDRLTDEPRYWVVVSIADPGIGIPGADHARVFERRRRGRNVGRIQGNGLGLAGAAEVVRLHGGEIKVVSEEGHGSTFVVRLPLTVDQ